MYLVEVILTSCLEISDSNSEEVILGFSGAFDSSLLSVFASLFVSLDASFLLSEFTLDEILSDELASFSDVVVHAVRLNVNNTAHNAHVNFFILIPFINLPNGIFKIAPI